MRWQGLTLKARLQAPATPSLDRRWHIAVQLDAELVERARSLGGPVVIGLTNGNDGRYEQQRKHRRNHSHDTLTDHARGHNLPSISNGLGRSDRI
jgi:hypothetical protein